MKKHNLFKVVGITILVTLLLSWILPTSYYQYSLVSDGTRAQVGLFDLLSYPTMALSYFGNVIIFILAVGAFYGVLNKIGAYRTLLDKIANGAKGKEALIFSIIIILIAALTSISGASIAMLLIIPFVISLILMMGYDKITAAMATVGPIAVGLIGNTFSSTYVVNEAAYSISAQNGMGVVNSILGTSASDMIIVKIIVLLLGIAILIFNTLCYSKKHKVDNKEIKIEKMLIPSVKENTKRSWPIVLIFDLIFLITILSQISWTSVFGVDLFDKITTAITSFKVFGFPIFAKVLGNIGAFEQWTLENITVLLVLGSGLLALIYRVKFNDFINSMASGVKKALKPAVLVALIYIVLIIVNLHPFVLTIIKPLISKNVFFAAISAFVASVFNVDLLYAASNVLPYHASVLTELAVTEGSTLYSSIALVWQAMYGFAALVAPTSVVLIATLSYLGVPYGKWLKSNWKFLVEMLLLIGVMIIVMTFI